MELSEPLTHARERDMTSSGVSWGAVIGGAFVTAALSLILLALGAGFGLSEVSPWSNVGATASTVGSIAIVWLVFTEIVACSMGGYLAAAVFNDVYSVKISALPVGTYLSELTMGTRDVGHKPLNLGQSAGPPKLHVVLGTDGGAFTVSVLTSDGNPVQHVNICIVPDIGVAESTIADWWTLGVSDAFGMYTSPLLQPGKYLLLATMDTVDASAGNVSRVFGALNRFEKVELGPRQSRQMSVRPVELR